MNLEEPKSQKKYLSYNTTKMYRSKNIIKINHDRYRCYTEKSSDKNLSKTFANQTLKKTQSQSHLQNQFISKLHKRNKTQNSQHFINYNEEQNKQVNSHFVKVKMVQIAYNTNKTKQKSITSNQFKLFKQKYKNKKSLSLFMTMRNQQRKQISLKQIKQQNQQDISTMDLTNYAENIKDNQFYNTNIIYDKLKKKNLQEPSWMNSDKWSKTRRLKTQSSFSPLKNRIPNKQLQQNTFINLSKKVLKPINSQKQILSPIKNIDKKTNIKSHIFIPLLAKGQQEQKSQKLQNLINFLQNQQQIVNLVNNSAISKSNRKHSFNKRNVYNNSQLKQSRLQYSQEAQLDMNTQQQLVQVERKRSKLRQQLIGRIKKQKIIKDISFNAQQQQQQPVICIKKPIVRQLTKDSQQDEQKTIKIHDNSYRKQNVVIDENVHKRLLQNSQIIQEDQNSIQPAKTQQKQDNCIIF